MNKIEKSIYPKKFDVVIVGAGPGGLFTAYELVESCNQNIRILLIDKGSDISGRYCPAFETVCKKCKACHLISGAGGAGLFSDGKITIDLGAGSGHLKEIWSTDDIKNLKERIIKIIKNFSPSWTHYEIHDGEKLAECLKKGGLEFETRDILHFGSNNAKHFLISFISYLQNKGVKFLFNANVRTFIKKTPSKWLIETEFEDKSKDRIEGDYLIVAVGKEGHHWFRSIIENMGGHIKENNMFSGIRLEINDSTARPFYKITLDPKIRGNHGSIKTHCFCRHGQILLLKYFDLPLLGGHTPFIETDAEYNPRDFPNSNFAILYRNPNISSWKEAINYMKRIEAITNGNLLIQRLGDYLKDSPTTYKKLKENSIQPSVPNITPGQLSDEILPSFRDKILPFLESLDVCIPGFLNPDNLIYAPAIEWWSVQIEVNRSLEVKNLHNLYSVGDCSGMTLGLFQSAATGIMAAKDIIRKIEGC